MCNVRFRVAPLRVVLAHGELHMVDDIDDTCTHAPEMTAEDKEAFFASLAPQPEPTDAEMEEWAAKHDAEEMFDYDFDGRAEGHRDSYYWA